MFSPSHGKRKDSSNTANVTPKKHKDSPENSPSNQLTDSKSEMSPERKISDFDMDNTEEDFESSQAIIEENEKIVELYNGLKDQIKNGELKIQDYLAKAKQHDPAALSQRNPKEDNFNALHYLAYFKLNETCNESSLKKNYELFFNFMFANNSPIKLVDNRYNELKQARISPFMLGIMKGNWIYQQSILSHILSGDFNETIASKILLQDSPYKKDTDGDKAIKKNRPWTARIIIHECLVQLNQLYNELLSGKTTKDSEQYKKLERKKDSIESYLLTLLSNRELFDKDTLDYPKDLEDVFKLPVLILIYQILQPTHHQEKEHQVKFFKKILSTLKEKGLLSQLAKEKCKIEPPKNLKDLEKGDSFLLFFSATCKLKDSDTVKCFSLIVENKPERKELFLEKNEASKNILGKIFSLPTRSCIIDILFFLLEDSSEKEFNSLIESSKEIIGEVIVRFPENIAEQSSGKMTDKGDFLVQQTQRRLSASFKPSIPQQAIKLLRDKFPNLMEKHFPTNGKPVVRLDQNSSPDEIQAYFNFGANIVKQQLEEKKQIQDQLAESNLKIESLESSVKTLGEESTSKSKMIEEKDSYLTNLKAQVEKLILDNNTLQQNYQLLSQKASNSHFELLLVQWAFLMRNKVNNDRYQ